MTKRKSISWNNVFFRTRGYEKQTEMKHKVFSYYLPIWFQILGRWNENLNYIDGFGRIGAYHTIEDIKKNKYISDNYGSPILSIHAISNLKKDKKTKSMDSDLTFITNEKKLNSKNCQSIRRWFR